MRLQGPEAEDRLSITWIRSSHPQVEGNRTVLIDYSHENAVAIWELNLLIYELSSRGYSVRYLNSSKYLEEMLDEADAFIVISPEEPFQEGEISQIKEYVEDGGRLLLITDPTRSEAGNINTLSAEFKIVFAEGYLYNLEENYGNSQHNTDRLRGERGDRRVR